MANISIEDLSFTISELIDLEPEQQNLIESAVNRAISAKDITGGSSVFITPTTPIVVRIPIPIVEIGLIFPAPSTSII